MCLHWETAQSSTARKGQSLDGSSQERVEGHCSNCKSAKHCSNCKSTTVQNTPLQLHYCAVSASAIALHCTAYNALQCTLARKGPGCSFTSSAACTPTQTAYRESSPVSWTLSTLYVGCLLDCAKNRRGRKNEWWIQLLKNTHDITTQTCATFTQNTNYT